LISAILSGYSVEETGADDGPLTSKEARTESFAGVQLSSTPTRADIPPSFVGNGV